MSSCMYMHKVILFVVTLNPALPVISLTSFNKLEQDNMALDYEKSEREKE